MRFGLHPVDDALSGAPVLLRAMPGVDHRAFLAAAIASQRAQGGDVVYITTDRRPEAIKAAVGPVTVIDAFSRLFGMGRDAVDAHNPAELVRAIETQARRSPDALVIFDAASSLALRLGPDAFGATWPRLRAALARFAQALVVDIDWDAATSSLLAGFGDEVRLLGVEDRIIHTEYVRVQGRRRTGPLLFHVVDGRLRLHVPKVVVTGPADAGKSTFIRTLCPEAAGSEHNGVTVAGDRGRYATGDTDVELFGTAGQPRFDPLLPAMLGRAAAAVVVVDATDRERFQRARDMLALVRTHTSRVAILANKADLPGAWAPERLAAALGLTDATPVVAGSAKSGPDARRVIDTLLTTMLEAP